MKVGMFVGKFLPPHKGHKWAILEASKQCDQLYVVVGHDPTRCADLCEKAHLPYIDLATKTAWLKQEFADHKNIKIIPFDESGIPSMPFGWQEWTDKLKQLLNTNIDVIFGSEADYADYYKKYFPTAQYVLQDTSRLKMPISATKIRQDWQNNLNWIIDSARPYFENLLK